MGLKKWKNPGSNLNSEYHGLYNSWRDMKYRAANHSGKYPSYSGVTVCKEWYDYDVFFEWAIKNGWKPGLTLDKDSIIPGNREYKPDACKWITRSENVKESLNRNGNPNLNKFAGDHPTSKKVRCIENGLIYGSCRDAENKLDLVEGSVARVANPKASQKTSKGYHFEYIGG